MFNLETLISDPYNRKARLQPALCIILPVVVAGFLMFPQFETGWPAIIALLFSGGGAVWLTQLGRDRGKASERDLFARWDGKPSVAMLRSRDTRLGEPLKARYRSFLAARVPGLMIPSSSAEALDPDAADRTYDAANAWLLAQTRDRGKFRLVFEENVNYGFRRNLWAMKTLGLLLDAACILLLVYFAGRDWDGELTSLKAEVIGATALTLVHLSLLIFVVRRNWVRVAAEAYAGQLLAACDTLTLQEKA